MTCFSLKNGSLYSWGKGEHERPKFDDYIEYSTPYLLLEDKHIGYISCGVSHVMCLDRNGLVYGWGEGKGGCLGLGDGTRRLSVVPISFFQNKRVIDVACGDRFTVVIAEFDEETEKQEHHSVSLMRKPAIRREVNVKANRRPLLGGDYINKTLKLKVLEIVRRNKERMSSLEVTSRNQTIEESPSVPQIFLPSINRVTVEPSLQSNSLISEVYTNRIKKDASRSRMNTDVSKLFALSKKDNSRRHELSF